MLSQKDYKQIAKIIYKLPFKSGNKLFIAQAFAQEFEKIPSFDRFQFIHISMEGKSFTKQT